jgi:hypothetical protein
VDWVYTTIYLMGGLQGAGTKEDMIAGAVSLQQAATRMYEMARRNSMLRITEAEAVEDEEVIVD